MRLKPGESFVCRPRQPHLVTNAGDTSATFLVLQGIGEYDFVLLVKPKQQASLILIIGSGVVTGD